MSVSVRLHAITALLRITSRSCGLTKRTTRYCQVPGKLFETKTSLSDDNSVYGARLQILRAEDVLGDTTVMLKIKGRLATAFKSKPPPSEALG